MAVKSRPESSSKTIVAADDVEGGGCLLQKPTRRKMDLLLNSVGVQMAVVIIVFLQIPLLGTLLMIDYKVIQGPPTVGLPPRLNDNDTAPQVEPPGDDPPVVLAERILHTINIVILLVFLVEIILRVSARGSRIHTDGQQSDDFPIQVFDCGVVMLTFVLYVAFTAANIRRAAYGTGLLILLRLWRIRRIAKTIAQEERRKLDKTLATHRKAQKETEEQLKQTTSKLTAMQQEMDVLQQQLKVIHYIGKASPAISSTYSKVSEDLVTSDEESERYTDCDSRIQTPKTIETIQAEITAAGLGGRRFYSHSLTTSNSPSPATSFSHLVDEFLLNSEFKDFKDLSSLSKAAPTKVSVPDLVEHLQNADGKVKGQNMDDGPPLSTAEEADLTRDSAPYHHQHNHQQLHPPQTSISPSESQDEVVAAMEAGSPALARPRQLGEDGTTGSEQQTTLGTPPVVAPSSGDTSITTSGQGAVSRSKNEDKQHLIRDKSSGVRPEMSQNAERGHDNLAFEDELQEEKARKTSKVPLSKQYGSSTYLNEEGIPMTDL